MFPAQLASFLLHSETSQVEQSEEYLLFAAKLEQTVIILEL